MAIKTKNSRDTYRSNVKIRPLRQNGLEAQYQGLDIKQVDIDHGGLPILAIHSGAALPILLERKAVRDSVGGSIHDHLSLGPADF